MKTLSHIFILVALVLSNSGCTSNTPSAAAKALTASRAASPAKAATGSSTSGWSSCFLNPNGNGHYNGNVMNTCNGTYVDTSCNSDFCGGNGDCASAVACSSGQWCYQNQCIALGTGCTVAQNARSVTADFANNTTQTVSVNIDYETCTTVTPAQANIVLTAAQWVGSDTTVTLDASQSTGVTSYLWAITGGSLQNSGIVLSSTSDSVITFLSPSSDGTLIITLTPNGDAQQAHNVTVQVFLSDHHVKSQCVGYRCYYQCANGYYNCDTCSGYPEYSACDDLANRSCTSQHSEKVTRSVHFYADHCNLPKSPPYN